MAASNWGEKGWSIGEFGTGDENVLEVLTGQSLTSSLNSVSATAEVNDGWGRSSWGQGSYGITGTVLIQGQELSTSISSVSVIAEINDGWGAYSWGLTGWGVNTASPTVEVIGQNLTTSLNSVSFSIDGSILLTGQQLTSLYPDFQTSAVQNVSGTSDNTLFTFRSGGASNIQYIGVGWNVVGQPTFIVTAVNLDPNDQYTGTITITGGTFVSGQSYAFESPNVNVTGTANLTLDTNLANLTLNSVSAFPIIFAPVTAPGTPTTWGSGSWGSGAWAENIGLSTFTGTATIDIITPVNVTGLQLTTSLNSVSQTITGSVALTGQQLTLSLGEETVTGTASVSLTGQQLTSTLGSIDPAPDAEVTGIQLTTTLGSVDIDIAVAALVFGQQLTLSLGDETVVLNTPVNVTGQSLTLTLNSVVAKTNVTVNVTGNSLTGTTAQIYVGAWAPVNTGQSVVWTEVAA